MLPSQRIFSLLPSPSIKPPEAGVWCNASQPLDGRLSFKRRKKKHYTMLIYNYMGFILIENLEAAVVNFFVASLITK